MFQTMILPLWGVIDYIYYQFNRLQLVDRGQENIFRVRVTTYRGKPIYMDDGEVIQPGDLLLKIHLYNYQLMKQMCHLDSDIRRALYVYQAVEQSLPGLAQFVFSHPRANELKGVLGVTLLNRGIKKLGFSSFDIESDWYRTWKKTYMIPMYCICHGQFKLSQTRKLEPKYVIMSKERLFERYLKQ
ncbi:hypothetical protein [Ammoniphilus sp. CFH 90114]|uniref:YkoP family protein n=1 Tax=Ammoniphilus sp. CFH 90114 TaxID=2493665 RepID=UPI00100DAF25|nr:hypothetical protein [Ammoniphilus sp. CFH 90114]RXT13803.1 hypothetical protein EIZ39_06585 [Ammoniphilus sp. CFH 90114]